MRQYFYFLLLLAVLITPGCTNDAPAGAQTTIAAPAAPAVTPVPAGTPAPSAAPVEMAYLENVKCAIDQTTETAYHCNGKVRIKSGVYNEVKVIARYPDNNTFESAAVAMGGSNLVLKTFALFPDLKYRSQSPVFFVKLDKNQYPVIMNNESGTAYLNPPPTTAATAIPPPGVKGIAAPAGTTRKPAVTATTIKASTTNVTTATPVWAPTISSVSPSDRFAETKTYFYIRGWDFRQDPPPKVYLRRVGSSCEFCGVQAIEVRATSLTTLDSAFDLSHETSLPATYDLLITNSELQDSYGILRNAVVINEATPVPTEETTLSP